MQFGGGEIRLSRVTNRATDIKKTGEWVKPHLMMGLPRHLFYQIIWLIPESLFFKETAKHVA